APGPMPGRRSRRWCTRRRKRRPRRCPRPPAAKAIRRCTAPARNRTTCAATARATPRARWRGRPRRGATACWCANTNSSAAANWCWTGSSPAACRTNNASAGWRAGSTTPSARAAATRCGCRARRRSRWAWGRSTGIAACARWPCCRARPAMADALAADDIPVADAGAKPRSPAMTPGARAQALLAAAACLLPLLLQLPGALAVGFGIGAVAVAAASRQRPLPALLRLLLGLCGIVAVAAVLPGIGRDTACAMLAAMLALKPAETFGLRDGRSLVGFALLGPFAAFLLDQGPASLALGLVAALLALLALQRLAAEEAGVGNDGTRLFAWPAALGVLRLVALGLPLALAAFWLFPRLASPLWGLPERAGAKPGLSDSMSPGAWLDLMNDDSPAARVRFFGPVPAQRDLYWRGPVLWDFDGRTWRPARWRRQFPAPPIRPAGAGWDYEVDLEP